MPVWAGCCWRTWLLPVARIFKNWKMKRCYLETLQTTNNFQLHTPNKEYRSHCLPHQPHGRLSHLSQCRDPPILRFL